jgi:NADH:ubiquinone oxidoreductase subunit 5 (subunit L)/multisubunit Na+/H+ antiporter MnhA subunit
MTFVNFDVPFFLLFLVFFFLTVFSSLIFLSYLGLYGVFFLNFFSLFLLWVSSLFFFKNIFISQNIYNIIICKWIFINFNTKININFLFDPISFSFFLLTISIGIFVYVYAFCYFRYEPLVERFLLFLCLFILSMLFLVSSGNTLMLFLGWELIGLTSFFLINFWVTKISTLKAAFKAFSFNKVSDFFLLISLLMIYNINYDLDILSINNSLIFYNNFNLNILNFNINFIEIICFFLLNCCFIKSAQIGPHIWLPDSMEAPVPASSLIHSATLVSAGIFIILRFYSLFEISYYSFFILPFVGSITASYGGVTASYQSDIKRILAYSTISHCGFLMVLSSFNINEFVILYLYVHGFFKAAVFMCVGNIIRISKNYQDFRKMGLFYKYLPFECFVSFVCFFNLSGIPFSLGFFIKHLIFLGLQVNTFLYLFILFNIFCGAISGLFYSYRIFFYVFFDFKKSIKNVYFCLNKTNFLSKNYSNTSLLSNISILSLILISYVISFYLFIIILSKSNILSDFLNYTNYSNIYNAFNNKNTYFFINIGYINWFIIIFLLTLFFLNWRNLFFIEYYFNNLIFFLNFFIFIFVFNNIF